MRRNDIRRGEREREKKGGKIKSREETVPQKGTLRRTK